jgi:hypothetical protein
VLTFGYNLIQLAVDMERNELHMKISRVAALSIVVLVGVCLVFAISCGGDGGKEGALPVIKAGDTWTQKVTVDGKQYTLISNMTGEEVFQGIDCYLFEVSITPPLSGVSKQYGKLDKAKIDVVAFNQSRQLNGSALTSNMTMLYKYSNQPYPLSVGKTWVATGNFSTIYSYMGQTHTENVTKVYTNEVEKMETITVAAGTFNCFKIVKYDASHSVLDTQWVAAATKHFEVKEIDNESDAVYELTSYSVSN